MDKTWIKKEIFVSEGLDSGYPISFDVKDFAGYKFMCDNKRFITGLCLHDFDYCLTILYKNMPELLNADLNNVEE